MQAGVAPQEGVVVQDSVRPHAMQHQALPWPQGRHVPRQGLQGNVHKEEVAAAVRGGGAPLLAIPSSPAAAQRAVLWQARGLHPALMQRTAALPRLQGLQPLVANVVQGAVQVAQAQGQGQRVPAQDALHLGASAIQVPGVPVGQHHATSGWGGGVKGGGIGSKHWGKGQNGRQLVGRGGAVGNHMTGGRGGAARLEASRGDSWAQVVHLQVKVHCQHKGQQLDGGEHLRLHSSSKNSSLEK